METTALTETLRAALTLTARQRALWLAGALGMAVGAGGPSGAWISLDLTAMQALLTRFAATLEATPELTLLVLALGVLVVGVFQSALGAIVHGWLIAIAGEALTRAREARDEAGADSGHAQNANGDAGVHGTETAARGTDRFGATPLSAAMTRFWPLFGIRLLLGVSLLAPTLLVLVAFTGLVAYVALGQGLDETARLPLLAGVCVLIPLFVLAALAGVVLGWVEQFAMRACVLDRLGLRAAIAQGFRQVRARWVLALLLWFGATLLGVAGGGLLGTLAGLFTGPLLSALAQEQALTLWHVPLFAFGYVLAILGGSGLLALESTWWTCGYRQMGKGQGARGKELA